MCILVEVLQLCVLLCPCYLVFSPTLRYLFFVEICPAGTGQHPARPRRGRGRGRRRAAAKARLRLGRLEETGRRRPRRRRHERSIGGGGRRRLVVGLRRAGVPLRRGAQLQRGHVPRQQRVLARRAPLPGRHLPLRATPARTRRDVTSGYVVTSGGACRSRSDITSDDDDVTSDRVRLRATPVRPPLGDDVTSGDVTSGGGVLGGARRRVGVGA